MEIQELDRRTVELIVSGEVYVRPLSIVKECVENSLDAGAKRIQIYIENGGYSKIQVDDNGSGITREVLPNLCKDHFTTKDRGKSESLGFRGEALACLCYMCNISITTKTDEDPIGTRANFEDGALARDLQHVAMGDDHGTCIEVTEIYKVHKVRRNNKNQANAERAAIAAFIVDLRIYYSDIVFILTDQNGVILKAQRPYPNRSYKSRVPVLCNSFPSLRPEYLTELTLTKLWGGVRAIICLKQGRDNLTDSKFTVFVNSRPIVWQNLKRMVLKTYDTYMSVANSMNLVLFWDMTITLTDENVDRTKLSLQVMDEALILADVETELKATLNKRLNAVVDAATMKGEDDAVLGNTCEPAAPSPGRKRSPRVSILNFANLPEPSADPPREKLRTYYLDSNRYGPGSEVFATPYTPGTGGDRPRPQILRIDSTKDIVPNKSQVELETRRSRASISRISPRSSFRGYNSAYDSEDGEVLKSSKRQTLPQQLKPTTPREDVYDTIRRELQAGSYEILPSFEFIGTVDMRKFVAGCDTCMVTVDLTKALKSVILPSLMIRTKLRPELNLLEDQFLSAAEIPAGDITLNCNALGLEIKNSVLRAIPRLPVSEPSVPIWVEMIYERGFDCHYDADLVCELMLEHEHRLQSHYTRFISGAKLWETWTKKNRHNAPDEIVVSPPLKTILKHFERC